MGRRTVDRWTGLENAEPLTSVIWMGSALRNQFWKKLRSPNWGSQEPPAHRLGDAHPATPAIPSRIRLKRIRWRIIHRIRIEARTRAASTGSLPGSDSRRNDSPNCIGVFGAARQ